MFFKEHKVKFHQAAVFLITASLYSVLHASRTSWAYSKPAIAAELGYTDSYLALLDSSFLCAYAIGLYINGWLGDRLKVKTLLIQGMFLTIFALSNFIFAAGFMEFNSLLFDIFLFALNGLGQSTAFPGCIAILTNWFNSQQRGLVFGAWMVNINLGNVFGQQLGKTFLDVLHTEWQYVLLLCTGLILILTGVMMKFLYATPTEVGVTIKTIQQTTSFKKMKDVPTINDIDDVVISNPSLVSTTDDLSQQSRGIGFWEAWKQPGVLLYSIVYICTKACTSGLLFWLPIYLKLDVGFKEDTADLLACLEAGQLIGVLLIGYLSDKLCSKAVIITSSLFGAMVIFFSLIFIKSPEYKVTFIVLLLIGGILVGGPAGLIVGAISSDLGEHKEVGGPGGTKVKATSTITGIIDGSGTVGAAAVQPIISIFRGQSFVIYTVLLLVATILTPFAHKQASKNRYSDDSPGIKEDIEVNVQDLKI